MHQSVADRALKEVMDLVRAEFREIPGLSLTREHIRRLSAWDAAIGNAVIGGLVESIPPPRLSGPRFKG